MKNKWMRGICAGLSIYLLTTSALLTGCNETEEAETTTVTGRVTAISDTEITLTVFAQGEQPDGKGVSGGAFDGKEKPEGTPSADMAGEKPDGTPPADMAGEKPEGTPSADMAGEKPEGTPPADMEGQKPDDAQAGGNPPDAASGGALKEDSSSEQVTLTIGKDVKVYTQQGEETTEASLSDVELGSMVSVEQSGDEAVSITLQTSNMRGGMDEKKTE